MEIRNGATLWSKSTCNLYAACVIYSAQDAEEESGVGGDEDKFPIGMRRKHVGNRCSRFISAFSWSLMHHQSSCRGVLGKKIDMVPLLLSTALTVLYERKQGERRKHLREQAVLLGLFRSKISS